MSTTAPLVTVAIPTRGRPALLEETLASITAQDYDGPLEILVVHDREEVDESLARLGREGRVITPMVNTRTGGLCGARNTGVLASHGEFVASCDDDDLWYPAKVRLQVAGCSRTPSCCPSAPASGSSWASAATSTGRRVSLSSATHGCWRTA